MDRSAFFSQARPNRALGLRLTLAGASFVFSIFQVQTLIQIFLFHKHLSDSNEDSNSVSPLSRNELARPQLFFLERRYKGSLLYTCSLRPRWNGYYDEAWRRKRLATVIVFQSNSGYQLQNFMAYHSPVIGSGGIVIIDHYVEGREIDPDTVSLLDEHSKLGSDVWRCNGSFLYKAEIWSDVIKQYTSSSEFVFPLDIDEFISVIRPKPSKGIFVNGERHGEILSWNQKDFDHALHHLGDTGKPFKMEGGVIYPSDCGNLTWPGIETSPDPLQMALVRKVKYIARRKDHALTCMDKVFMRGRDFEATDGGNHLGKTHKFAQRLCPLDPLPEQKSELFLIHIQLSNFEEWLLHGLRGAAARDYNRFTNLKTCFDGMLSGHYCDFWQRLMKTKLDPWRMKKLYRDNVCKSMIETNEPITVPEGI